ncbi:double-strand break repair protein AddB [Hyphobacterium marinum]|uniref:Double-strand break repair protein AddB n=1 Tax=Hyphobacterium marinum TaxID=3116574 RepID=A0ABU7LUG7_9PROT|nr:double-strand break repair protein AddB [Hyphobacterium sp. Y6023]MEE2565206.1 double-strand break repair protein AddB [Hyphobacterium sp. Y6023]
MSAWGDTGAPRVFTMPPQADFLDALARHVLAEFGGDDPEALADVTILTPTRRAGRALMDAFARAAGPDRGALILPLIRPIGDVDADEPPFEPGELAGIAPPAVEPARRQFELARLILAKEAALGRRIGIAGAMALAEPLAVLIDDLWTEETGDLAAFGDALRARLPGHLQESLDFLSIVNRAWPQRLAELQLTDAAQRRSALLHALADRWRETPPEGPVIAAGSTGSIPAAAELMAVVARLPQGAVVLPGLDRGMDDKAWEKIDSAHPQWALKDFLERLDLDRADIGDWPGAEAETPALARQRVIAEALRPAEETADWLKRIDALKEWSGDFFASGFSGLSLVEARNPDAEARAIALMLRETLSRDDETAMVVTPDRGLARRISSELRRFGVQLDDSAGTALTATLPGGFLRLVLDVASDPGSALALNALWASPLFSLGRARGPLKRELDLLDLALRGARPGNDFDAIRKRLADPENRNVRDHDRARLTALAGQIETALTPLLTERTRPAADWARALAEAAEALAASDRQAGADRLWAGEGGEAAATLLREFITEAEVLPDLTLAEFAAAFGELAGSRRVRPQGDLHPRLRLFGPLEARLLTADRVILAGLNEGVWPAGLGSDPWLSRGMREEAGLPPQERRFGLAAHDFAQLAGAKEAILTRSLKADGAPTVASRWIWRLQTLARGALGEEGAKQALSPALDYTGLAEALDHAASAAPVGEPYARPPVAARPKRLSVTDVRKWIRDPYAIHARHVLKLVARDDADLDIGPRERGSALHAALEAFIEAYPEGDLPEDAAERLLALGDAALEKAGFDEAARVEERVRFARSVEIFLEWEAGRRRQGIRPGPLEIKGEWDVPGTPLTVSGIADRIDFNPDGTFDIIDYKTGAPPTKAATAANYEPQLPLEAAMAAAGAFPGLDPSETSGLIYLRLSGGRSAGGEARIDGPPSRGKPPVSAMDYAAQYEDLLRQLIETYADPEMAYRSQPRAQYVDEYGDYDRLARRKEWADAATDGEGGEA